MASTQLRQRVTADPTTTDNGARDIRQTKQNNKRSVMAKRGLKSLAIAVSFPLALTLFSIYITSSQSSRAHVDKPFWFPPSWALHLTCLASTLLTGVSAWMVWADGGFHRNPVAMLFYLAQLLCTVVWNPIVFGAGAARLGLVVCFGLLGSMIGCMRVFGKENPVARDLIKPCLAWIAFISLVNLKLLFL